MSIKNGHARWAFNCKNWNPTLDELKIAVSCIQAEEKSRLIKFYFLEDFKSSLIGRLLMRKFLCQALNVDNTRISLGRDVKGKPFLKEIDGETNYIDFNVSHQGSFAVLAGYVGQSKESVKNLKIGVDLMKIEYGGGKPLMEFFRLMTRNFSSDEWGYIKSFNSNYSKLEAFMRNWCLKESYVKNVGTGITVDLQKIDFRIKSPELSTNDVVTDTTLKVDDLPMNDWTFEESLIDSEHCVAVSLQHSPIDANYAPFNFELIDFDNLIVGHKSILEVDENYCREVLKKQTKN
jgi:4'-phosphopantetheinyl transferase